MGANDKQPRTSGGDRLEWFTVRYRSLAVGGFALLVLGALVWTVLHRPQPASAPPAAMIETGARFASIDGTVEVKRANTLEWIPATRAMVLRQNDLVRTRSGGTAEIRFADGTLFNVRPDSLMTIEESTQNPISRQQRVRLAIHNGEANFTTGRAAGNSTEISTPTVRTRVERETAGSMQVSESGETGVRIFNGAAQAETKTGQRVALARNEGLKIDAAGTAGSKTALPVVPQLMAPPNQTETTFPDLTRGVTLLLWNAVPGATSYRVMVDYSAAFARPLYDRQGQRGTQMELRGLEAGSYYWKVAAVDPNGEGGFSEVWRFALAKAPQSSKELPLVVEALELKGNVLHVRGRTESGASLVLNGEPIDVQPDGTFNEFLTFEGSTAANVLLRASGAGGGVAEQRRRVTVVD